MQTRGQSVQLTHPTAEYGFMTTFVGGLTFQSENAIPHPPPPPIRIAVMMTCTAINPGIGGPSSIPLKQYATRRGYAYTHQRKYLQEWLVTLRQMAPGIPSGQRIMKPRKILELMRKAVEPRDSQKLTSGFNSSSASRNAMVALSLKMVLSRLRSRYLMRILCEPH